MRYLKLLLSLTLFLSFCIQSKAQYPSQGLNGNIDDFMINPVGLEGIKIKLSNDGVTTSVKYDVDMSRSSSGTNSWHPINMKVGLGYKDNSNNYKFFNGSHTFINADFGVDVATLTKELTAVVDHSKLPVGSAIYMLYMNESPNVPESDWPIEAFTYFGKVIKYDFIPGTGTPGGPVEGVPPGFTAPITGSIPLYEYVSGNIRRLTTVYYSSYPDFTYAGIFGYVFASAEAGTVPLYRYKDPSNGNYYYTTTLTTASGYNYDGIACYVYGNQVASAFPVYENYSLSLGRFHRYSTTPDIIPNYSFEGVKFYILQNSFPPVPIFVYHDGPATDHYFTPQNSPSIGNGSFVNEGIAFYAFSQHSVGTVPIYVYYSPNGADHYFTPVNQPTIANGAYRNEGVAFYAYPTGGPGRVPIFVYNGIHAPDHYFTPDNQPTIGGGGYRNEGVAFYGVQ